MSTRAGLLAWEAPRQPRTRWHPVADELRALRAYVEVMQAGAADNTWDADGRADLFAANALLEQLRKASA